MGAFWDAWDKYDKDKSALEVQGIQKATGLAALMKQGHQLQQQQRLQGMLADPNLSPEQKRAGLMGLMTDPGQVANMFHQQATEKATNDLRTAQMTTQQRMLEEAQRKAAAEQRVAGAQQSLQGLLSPDTSPTGGETRTPFVGTETQLVEHMKKSPGVYSLVDPMQVRGLQAVIDPRETIKGMLSGVNPQQGYTLSPGAIRFGPNGQQIAAAPFAPRQEPSQQVVQTAQGPAVLPRGSTTVTPLTDGSGKPLEPAKPIPPPMQSARDKAMFNAGLKEVERDDKDAANAAALEVQIKRWQELNARTLTGPIVGQRPISFDDDYQELKKIENNLAVNNFKPGQGQISNFERELIKGSGPNTKNNPKTNENITNIMLGGVQTTREKSQFKEWYLETKNKTLGADAAWQAYVEANPRFVSDKKGGIVPNPKRVEWLDHFTGEKAPTKPPAQAGATVESLLEKYK